MSKAEKTRQFIVEKTAHIFNMKGFAGTSLSDITNATGLTKGSIYGNFANKDEVALAGFDYNVFLLNKGIDEATSGGTDAIDTLLKMAGFYRFEFKKRLATGGCPILNAATDADDTHRALKEKASNSIKDWKKRIETIIKKGVAKNEIVATVNAAEFATEFISMIEGGIMLAKTTGDVSMLNTCITRIEKIINSELRP